MSWDYLKQQSRWSQPLKTAANCLKCCNTGSRGRGGGMLAPVTPGVAVGYQNGVVLVLSQEDLSVIYKLVRSIPA